MRSTPPLWEILDLPLLGVVALGDDLLKPVTECLTAFPLLSLEALAILVLTNSW